MTWGGDMGDSQLTSARKFMQKVVLPFVPWFTPGRVIDSWCPFRQGLPAVTSPHHPHHH